MAIYAIFRTDALDGDVGNGVVEIHGIKYPVYRTSPLYGDMGNDFVLNMVKHIRSIE